jgi:hypothetical protein
MKTVLTVSVLAALAFGGGQALAAANGHHAVKTLTVVMHDPGCHWFMVHGKVAKTASVTGPIRLRDLDENTLEVVSRTKASFVRIGKSIVLSPGHYVVMMVDQAVDDNYLTLTVR